MSPSHARWWNKTKAGGLLRFVIVRGVLLWAGGTFALVTVMMLFTDSWEPFVAHNLERPFYYGRRARVRWNYLGPICLVLDGLALP